MMLDTGILAGPRAAARGRQLPIGLLEFLSVREGMDLHQLRDTALRSAVLADGLGWRRCWVAEHHSRGVPSTNPLTWLPVLGSLTRSIRIGTAVSLLRLRNPYLVAEDFATASHFLSGRLDVGLGRGDVSGPGTEVLDDVRQDGPTTDAAMQTVVALLDEGNAWIDPAAGSFQRWLHGSGVRSAELAADWGFDYCHALFFNPDLDACLRPLEGYRTQHPTGRTAVAVALVCNRDPKQARIDAVLKGITVNTVGTPEQCAATICHLLSLDLIDEVVVTEQSSRPADHFAALAELADLVERELRPPVGARMPSGHGPDGGHSPDAGDRALAPTADYAAGA